MKKRWIAILMCFLLLLLAAACGKEEEGPNSLLNTGNSQTEQSESDSQSSVKDSKDEDDDMDSEKTADDTEDKDTKSSKDSKESKNSKDSKEDKASKKENSSGSSSEKGPLSEKQALKQVFKQAKADYGEGASYVKESSGTILDQNGTAYIISFEICMKGHEENNFMEAYWINKKTREIRDVCGINEYFEGMIDITNGTALF